MTAPSLSQRALALFDELAELDAPECERRLQALREHDPALHAEVASMLAMDRASAAALDRSPASLLADATPADADDDALIGQRIGPWRITGIVGRGGMGAVYRGERDDGEFQQQAAIKLIRLGLDQPELRRRFLRERQILARLRHPNIATLLDGGVSDNGAPYFAMELIDGAPIDRWCDGRKLDLRARIRLLLQVCGAVQHAHQNLTVHRDLKPSNILVTADGQARLLDFGIAKLLEADTDGATTVDRPFTPEYAAPEQIRGEAITTATDLYALGVLMYRLLADTHPFGAGTGAAALAQLQREPESLPRAAERTTPAQAQARQLTPRTLAAALRGDLAAIVQRCLQSDPSRRYASAEALGLDLKAWLDGRPVAAGRGDRLYRARKFVRRHRWGVAASLAALLAIGGALAAALWQAERAREQAAIARSQAIRATAVRDFLVGIFEHNSLLHPDGAAARKATAEELLAIGARRIRGSMREAPLARVELLGTMGDLYSQLALQAQAQALYREQLHDARALHRGPHPQVAEALQKLAYSQVEHGDYVAGEKTVREALRMFDALGDRRSLAHALALATLSHVIYRTRPQEPEGLRAATAALRIAERHHPGTSTHVDMLLEMGRVLDIQQGIRAAEPYVARALQLALAPSQRNNLFQLAVCYQNMGDTERLLGRYAEAEATLRKAFQTYVAAAGAEHPYASDARRELARVLGSVGNREEALQWIGEGLRTLERTTGADNPNLTSYSRLEYAGLLLARGELTAAAPEIDRAVAAWRAAKTGMVGRGLVMQARLQTAQGRYAQAGAALAEAEPVVVEVWGDRSPLHAGIVVQKGRLALAQGDLAAARSLFERVLREWEAKPDVIPAHFVDARLGLARAQLAAGENAAALEAARAALAQIRGSAHRAALPDQEAEGQMLLGVAMLRSGQETAALAPLQSAVAGRERLDAEQSPWLAEAHLALASALEATDADRARRLRERAAAALARQPELGDYLRAPWPKSAASA